MIRTLIVDDDSLTLELHRDYVARLEGFEVAGECTGARAAVTAVLERPGTFDLVLLDITMPDGSGIDVLRAPRGRSAAVDVIAITGVRDAEAVRQMAALGVFQYLVKPFPFAVFRERMEQYRTHREQARATDGEATQAEIDTIKNYSFKINDLLKAFMLEHDIELVDFKLEFGRLPDGTIVLADEISPDTCRLWDVHTHEKLDKDRFRRDLGGVEDAYNEVMRRLIGDQK